MNIKEAYDFYHNLEFSGTRQKQLDIVFNLVSENLDFDKLDVIETGASQNLEDGCFGLFFCKLAQNSGGSFSSVDNSPIITEKSKEIYKNYFNEFKVNHHVQDSVEFLKNYKGFPNLIHLDSWDLDLKDPIASMLHGWLEFSAIKDKMPIGSIIVIDDNYMNGTLVEWNYFYGGKFLNREIINISYEIVGKGSLVYHWAQAKNTDWELLGNHYVAGDNIKVIVKKIK